MIQRIQTVYLLLVAIAMGFFTVMDIFVVAEGVQSAVIDAWTVRVGTDTSIGPWGIGVLSILTVIVALVEIFLYKRRTLQSRVGVLNVLLLVGLCAYIGYTGYTLSSTGTVGLRFAVALPLVSIILQVMSIRQILADEALVRMSNRLR